MRAWSRRERVLLVIIAVLFVGMARYWTLVKDALCSSNRSLGGGPTREKAVIWSLIETGASAGTPRRKGFWSAAGFGCMGLTGTQTLPSMR